MSGDLEVTITNPADAAAVDMPGFFMEWLHERVSDAVVTVQNDFRVRVFDQETLDFVFVDDTTPALDGAAAASSNSAGGTISWTNPTNALVDGVDYAVASGAGITHLLKLTGATPDMPDEAQIVGIIAAWKKKAALTVEYVGKTAGLSGTSPLSMTKPTGVVQGDVIVVLISSSSSVYPAAPDNGPWTALDQSNAGTRRSKGWTKIAGASEPASYASVITGTSKWDVIAYRGAKLPYTSELGIIESNTITPLQASDTTHANDVILRVASAIATTGTWSTISGHTERADATATLVIDKVQVAIGDTGSVNATFSTTDDLLGATILMEPGGVVDSRVSLILPSGALGSTNKADGVSAWPSADGIATYGGNADVWGEIGLTGADVKDADFGIAIAAINPTASAVSSIKHGSITYLYQYEDVLQVATVPVYDSGQISDPDGEYTLPDDWGPSRATSYWLRVDVTDTDGLEGASDPHEIVTSWDPPDLITGLVTSPVGGT